MTLTETAIFTKKALVFVVLFLFLVLASWGGYSYWYNFIYLPNLPPVIEKPTTSFGLLPKPNLPKSQISSETLSYTLDTETGKLPSDTPIIYRVYSIAQLATDLLALDRAKELARTLGFSNEPEMLTATEYRFLSNAGGTLTINLDTGNFRFQRSIATDSASLQSRENFQNQNNLALQFKNYLAQKNLLKDQLKDGRTKVEYNAEQDKNIADISIWEQDIDETPIVTDTFTKGLIRATVVNSGEEVKKYAALEYTFWPIDTNNFATYPIKTPDQAFKELENGDESAVIIAPKSQNISITKVYLAYLLTEDYISYLQPVYVFEGPDFAAYVTAITSEFLEK